MTNVNTNQIVGLNAARLFGIDVKARRNAIKADKLSRVREEYRQNPSPSNTQYGWVWVGQGAKPTVPVGNGKRRAVKALQGRVRSATPRGK